MVELYSLLRGEINIISNSLQVQNVPSFHGDTIAIIIALRNILGTIQ